MSIPSRTTDVLDEYPASGVTVWFTSQGRVAKLNFHGPGGALYAGPNSMIGENWIPSDHAVVFGLTARASAGDFDRALGTPASQVEAGASSRREVRRVWRKDGLVIDATFLAVERDLDGKVLPAGSLLWFEVSHGV